MSQEGWQATENTRLNLEVGNETHGASPKVLHQHQNVGGRGIDEFGGRRLVG
jgi:hypothetical protein